MPTVLTHSSVIFGLTIAGGVALRVSAQPNLRYAKLAVLVPVAATGLPDLTAVNSMVVAWTPFASVDVVLKMSVYLRVVI